MKVYYDSDADLKALDGQTVGIIGYGNQGRAQALNLRDSAVNVIVGSISDRSFEHAEEDGFSTMPIADAVDRADILFLLIPDEVQKTVYDEVIGPRLRAGQALNFAHGYNIRFGLIRPPQDIDVIMVAPRMIGVGVRERFEAGSGAPAFVAVEQDATGTAWHRALALAKAIGATKAGALGLTFAQETEMDLFMEQGVWPVITRVLVMAFEILVEQGFPPEAVVMEMYGSGEAAQILQEMAKVGIYGQMSFHSQTSQYGTLSRGPRMLPDSFRDKMLQALEEIKSGTFATEWNAEQKAGYPVFNELKDVGLSHPINEAEKQLRRIVQEL
ncbi:MAG: ketol-acid reductoisomerase [Anaerolineae bacterium]|nr:ketol-acid reductoisomerase [Anaerolineae bacterium]